MKADLHVHTNVSDSSYSIEDTIKMAKENGVTHLGITDHDTTNGLKKAIKIGKHYGVNIIPGIEISAFDFEKNKKIHILGYNFNLDAPNIRKICDEFIEKRHNNSLWQIERLSEQGYDITVAEVAKRARYSTCFYKQHIMDVLIEKGYTDKVYSELYYQLFKGEGICSRDIRHIDVFEAVKAIKADGGIAILAHPGQQDSYYLIDDLVKAGLDGVEIYHEDHTVEDYTKIFEYRDKYNLILTGGSDYHGIYGSDVQIGNICMPDDYIKYFHNEINDTVEFTKTLVKRAGRMLKKAMKSDIEINFKNSDHRDLVTKYDLEVETYLTDKIKQKYPDHSFITEENTNNSTTNEEYVWIIDPIDGTTNFINFKKDFTISIALYKNEEPLFGVIYDVMKNDMYVAISKQGAFLNGRKLNKLDQGIKLKQAIVDTSLNTVSIFKDHYNLDLVWLAKAIRGHRACGTASLAICKIGTGEINAYISAKLCIWDYAAAVILLRELGGSYSFIFENLTNGLNKNRTTFIATTNSSIHNEIIGRILSK
ncbi:inositol monophosphatase family protein [Brassicibacter mesophilus]|uniref:inositol monophosphatase family protein n=1 Tax=Brassicibacter mesophilus TaxID=745119 RepID=UPI003D192A72